MTDDHPNDPSIASPILRLLDRASVEPALLSSGVALSVSAAFLIAEIASGRL